jgi:hypothetical protein
MQGFFAGLPPTGVQFFDRNFVRAFPKPLQVVATDSWQKGYDIWRKTLTDQTVLVIRDLSWTAFRNNNIGVGIPEPIDPGTLGGSLGFQLLIGDRWQLDIKNNRQGAGSATVNALGGNSGISNFDSNVNGRMDPTGAPFSARYGTASSFALYAQGGEELVSKFYAFAKPPIEVVAVQFNLNGWAVPKALWTHMLETGQWGITSK